jgi:hypothetical protein
MKNRSALSLLLAAAALAPVAPALAAGPAGTGSPPNVRMNAPQRPAPEGRLGRAAVAVAATEDGQRIVAAWETIQGGCGGPYPGEPCPKPEKPGLTAIGYSTDGGKTWTEAGAPMLVDGIMTGGHPWLARGGADDETFYLANRGRNLDFSQNGITFHRGRFKDGAFVWEEGKRLAPARQGDVWRSTSLVAAPGGGQVYLALSNLRAICGMPSKSVGQIELLRSADEGRTWEGPVIVAPDEGKETADPKDPECGKVGPFQIAPSPALGPNGELYLIWQYGPNLQNANIYPMIAERQASIRFAKSLDGGKTFSPPRDVARFNSMWENPPVGYSKDNLLDFARIAVATAGPHRGRIYVTYAAALTPAAAAPTKASLVSSQVFLTWSDDQGANWQKPVALAPATLPPTGVKRFRPSVAVGAAGNVDVVYVEVQEKQTTADPTDRECTSYLLTGQARMSDLSSLMDLYWVRSTDGGATFGAPVRVTSKTTNWCTAFYDTAGQLFSNLGDYMGVFPVKDRVLTVWTDGRDHRPDAYFSVLGGSSK